MGVRLASRSAWGRPIAVDLATGPRHALGYDKLGCADLNTMAGSCRLHAEALKAQIQTIIGLSFELVTGEEFLPTTLTALHMVGCAPLLSKGKMADPEGGVAASKSMRYYAARLGPAQRGVHLIMRLPGCEAEHCSGWLDRLSAPCPRSSISRPANL